MVDTPYATGGPLPAVASPNAAVAAPAPSPAGPAPTPGPWRWRLDDYGGVEITSGPREAPVVIADVALPDLDIVHRERVALAVANACVLTAAPELLAAARLAQSALGMTFASYRERAAAETAAREALAAAIARAEGRISTQEGAE